MKFTKRNKSKEGQITGGNTTSSVANNNGSSSSVSTSLQMHTIWGQQFDGTQDVRGDLIDVDNITAIGNIKTEKSFIIKELDSEGNELDESNDLNISVDGSTGKFTGKDNYEFDGKIKGENAEILNDVSVGGSGKFGSDLTVLGSETVSGNFQVKGDTTLVDVKSNKITNKGDIITDNLTATGNSSLNNVTSNNITNTDTIKTKNLEVTGSAHFFELIIDKIKSAGGAAIFTPADGFDVDIVKEEKTGDYKLYWRCRDGNGNQRDNMWKVNDQALCMSFNQAKVGTSHDVSNKYYWVVVNAVSDNANPELIDGEYYNWIKLSHWYYDGHLNPEVGDSIVMLGYRGTDDPQRQSAIYISAYKSLDTGLTAPLLAQYKGINDFNLESHRASYWSLNDSKFVGNFEVGSGQTVEDYINDRINGAESGTPYIGANGNWYIWDKDSKSYKDSGVRAKGQDGTNGKDGQDGTNGKDGVDGKDGQSVVGPGNKVAYKLSSEGRPSKPNFTNPDEPTDGWTWKMPDEPINVQNVHQVYNTGQLTYEWINGNTWDDYSEFNLDVNYDNLTFTHWIKSPGVSNNGMTYMKVNFTTNVPNQEVLFVIKSYTTADYDFIWVGNVDDSTEPTYNRDKLKKSDRAVSGPNGTDKQIYDTIKTVGKHFVYVAYCRGGGGTDPNNFVLFRMPSFEWDGTPVNNINHLFESPTLVANQFSYTLFKFTTTKDNQEVQFYIAKNIKNSYVWLSNVDDTTTPVFDENTIKKSGRGLTPDDIVREETITDIIPKKGEHQIYVACYTNQDSERCSFVFVDMVKNKSLYTSSAIIENNVVTEWSEPYQYISYEQSYDVIAKQEDNYVSDTDELTCQDEYIIYRTWKGIKSEVSENDFIFFNLIKPYNIWRQHSNGVWFVQRERYKDMGMPDTFRIAIVYNHLAFPKVIMNKVIPIMYKASASFSINQHLNQISSRVQDNWTNISDLQGTVTSHTNAISTITQRANSIEVTVNQHTSTISDLDSHLQDTKDELANFKIAADAIHSEVKETIESVNDNVKTNSTKISEINQRADSIESSVSSMQTQIDNLGNITEVSKDISEIKQRADSIEATVKKHTESISDLDSRVKTNTDNISDVKQTASEISSTVSSHTKTISDLDGRVTTNTENISKIKQTADGISSTVESLGDTYVSKSELSQKSDEILAQVNNTYIKIGDTNITIGGDTTIEGSLTLTKSDQGFRLVGDTGITEIMPKSIGTFSEFQANNTNKAFRKVTTKTTGAKTVADNTDILVFSGSNIIKLGDRKKGDYVSIRIGELSGRVYNAYDSSKQTWTNSYVISSTWKAQVTNQYNSVTLKDFGRINSMENYSYTFEDDTPDAKLFFSFSGNTTESSWKAGYSNPSGQLKPIPMPGCEFTVTATLTLPTKAHMLIGYDGWGVNFGNNKTVYCGTDGFIASFGDHVFKVTDKGIIGNNKRTAAILSKANYNSDDISYTVTTDVDTVIALAKTVRIQFPSNPYDGYELKIYDKTQNNYGTCYITTSPYKLVMCRDWEGEIKKNYELDRFGVRTYTFFSGQWYEGYEGY